VRIAASASSENEGVLRTMMVTNALAASRIAW
jgi:hypothetical protein